MTFTTHQDEGQVLIRFQGVVCASEERAGFEAYLAERLAEGCREFIFNFGEVTTLTSLGLGIMVKALTEINRVHGRLMVCNFETIEAVLRITKTYSTFDLCWTEKDAWEKLLCRDE